MAASVTILKDLQAFTPVYNKMELSVQADAGTLALSGMKYVFDVYIENVTSPTYYRFQVPPDPDFDLGNVDISRYCEGACNSTLAQYNSVVPFSLGANANGTQSIIKVTVKYGYSYLSTPTTRTVVPNITVGSAKYAFQGALTNKDFQGWAYNTYICNITNGASGQFLTDMKTNYVSINNLGWHHILSDTPTDIDYLVVKTYDSAGALIQTATKAISVAQNLTSSRMYKVATGPESLNNMTGAFVSGAQPIIDSSVATYTVQLTNSASTVASETLTFIMQEPCRYMQRRIHFQNRFGSFDAFNFNLRSQIETTSERKGYKINKYPLTSGGITRQYQDQAQVTNYIKTQDYLTVRSEYLTEEQNNWLKQFINSTEIYLEFTDPSGAQNFLAYEKPEGGTWIEKSEENDKLFNIESKLKLSQSDEGQRR
jgi:hypothetical protein